MRWTSRIRRSSSCQACTRRAAIVLDAAKDAVVVPVEALDHSGATPQVFVVGANRQVEIRPVKVGLQTADRAQITSGITAGDLVVTGNRAQLKPGLLVTPRLMDASRAETDAH